MIRLLAAIGTIACVTASGAVAQSARIQSWNDLLKPYEAKTNPAVPVAPTEPVRPAVTEAPAPMRLPQPATRSVTDNLPKISYTPPVTVSTGLLDACIIEATGRLPKADGLQVTNSSYEFDHSYGRYDEVWRVSLSVKLGGRQAQYSWDCRIDTRGSARLK